MTIIYCPCCGSMLRPATSCRKGCTDAPVSGTMDAAVAQQGIYLAAQEAKAPKRAATPAPVATTTARYGRPMWQRRCTCGHCMRCIGE